jgi:transposase
MIVVARDARSLPSAAQEELRRTAVRLVGEGRSRVEVAGLLGVSRETVSRWMAKRQAGGDRALDARRRGRRGGHTKLSEREQQKIARLWRAGIRISSSCRGVCGRARWCAS